MQLITGQVCAITFRERGIDWADDDPGQTIIGTYTGEIDAWGKYTVQLLDSRAEGPYYLFADEVVATEMLSEAEIQAETETICEARLQQAAASLRQADTLLHGVETASRYWRASQVARCSIIVQRAIVAVEGVR